MPAAAGQQTKGAAMVHGGVEVFGLIPGRQALIEPQPEPVGEGAQQPDQAKAQPPRPGARGTGSQVVQAGRPSVDRPAAGEPPGGKP